MQAKTLRRGQANTVTKDSKILTDLRQFRLMHRLNLTGKTNQDNLHRGSSCHISHLKFNRRQKPSTILKKPIGKQSPTTTIYLTQRSTRIRATRTW